MLPSPKGLSFTFMLSQPIPLYLKQAFELLSFNRPYVDLFNHVSCLPLFSMMLLSERIYLWKLSMTIKRLLWLSMWFLLCKLWFKRLRSKYKYNLFIVLWPRTKVCHHQSWFTLCTFIVIPFAHCKLNYMKGSCYLFGKCDASCPYFVYRHFTPWTCGHVYQVQFSLGDKRGLSLGGGGGLIRPFCITILYHNLLLFTDIFHI
jgi:hypothetical protein